VLVSINQKKEWVFRADETATASCAATSAENILAPAARLPSNEEIYLQHKITASASGKFDRIEAIIPICEEGSAAGVKLMNWNSEVQLVLDHERRCRSFGA
jgi:hypothetical protein